MAQRATVQIFDGPGKPLRPSVADLPSSLPPGYALVALRLATICGSDIHTLLGHRQEPCPSILGHEGGGELVALGEGRHGFGVGDRITWTIADSCGACSACVEHGLPQKCRRLFKYGHAAMNNLPALSGCYASHIVLRPGTHLVPIPPALPDSVVAPANCALATMVCVLEKAPRPCRHAWIQGAGMLGLYGCALLHHMGVEQIFVSDILSQRLALVPRFGGIPLDARESSDRSVRATLRKAAPEGIDLVVEVAGHSALVAEGVELLRNGGTYLFAGMVHPNTALPITGEQIIRKCLSIYGTHNYAPRHLNAAVSFLARTADRFPFTSLVSDPLPLSDLAQAFELAQQQTWPRVAVMSA